MPKKTRPTYSPEFRLEAAQLVTDQDYSIREASEAMNVSKGAIELWVRQLRAQQKGITIKGAPLTIEQEEVRALKKKIKRIEQENDILKKATALLASDSLKSL